jgi:hypothetical protein
MSGSYVGKTLAVILATAFIINHSRAQSGQAVAATPPSPGYAVTERGADYKVLQKTTVENGTNRIHKYTELATGLNYQNAQGQWQESKEEITLLPTGGAAATQGRHKVYFPSDIYNGVLEVVTPDGRHLRSHPLGVSYDDGSNTVFIATLKHAQGYLTSSNQVTYRDAFEGIKADLVATYRRSGFECDLVFRQQPPTPGDFGLDESFSTLQLVTEFFNTQDPEQVPATSDEWYGLQDSTLKFGKLTMKQGKAFAFKGTNNPSSRPVGGESQREGAKPVYKRWLNLDGRKFLVEELPLEDLAEDLNALPLTASIRQPATSNLKFATNRRQFPPAHEFIADTNQILLAAADFTKESGVVLDYTTMDSDQTDFTFEANTTYYISQAFAVFGNLTIEPDAVIKVGSDPYWSALEPWVGGWGLSVYVAGSIICPSSGLATLTSMNDDSVGDIIAGSTGNPSPGAVYIEAASSSAVNLENLTFRYAQGGVFLSSYLNNRFENCRFENCAYCAFLFYGSVALTNVQFINVTSAVSFYTDLPDDSPTINAHSVTGSSLQSFVQFIPNFALDYVTLNLDECCFDNISQNITTLGENIQLAGGSFSWNQCDAFDLDIDGLPDWWELYWFGNYTHIGNELDAQGNLLLDDYIDSLDPNIIAFSIESTNDYVNHTNVAVELAIAGGVPSYYAIFVNSATSTNWLAFTTTNLNVNLGSTDGVYNVVVGLKGLPAEAAQTWHDYNFTLDRVKPVLSITNPAIASGTATVIKPYLQLQGFADKPLLSLSYDISNATGLFTNLDAFVTDQALKETATIFTNDFNTFTNFTYAFTTNYFRAYDVPLATNANAITLRVTDRAGNTTTTNFNVVLDYTTATNPPVVKLIWPTNGMTVSGTNITIRGTINDETGTIVATVVNGDGTTNVIAGLVERNGMFWIENVPLNGTNQISIQAIDASGNNTTTTNSIVNPSDLVLTIDNTPTGDDLYKPVGPVSGTVSDPAATVTVNGVTATVDDTANGNGTYNWSAPDVPMGGSGTATIDASATLGGGGGGGGSGSGSGGGEGGGGSGEGGSGSGSGGSSGSGSGGGSVQTSRSVERGHYVAITQHKATQVWTTTSAGGTNISVHGKGYAAGAEWNGTEWQRSYLGGSADYRLESRADYSGTTLDLYGWYNFGQPEESRVRRYMIDNSTPQHSVETYTNFEDLFVMIRSVPDCSIVRLGWQGNYDPPTLIHHYYAESQKTTWTQGTAPDIITTELQMKPAITEVKLYTGGKSGVKGKKSLFCLHCSGEAYGRAKDPGWIDTPRTPISPNKLKVMGKTPGADGKVWVALDDDSEQVITVTAKGVKDYNAGPQTTPEVDRFSPHITANTKNLEDEKPEFCVGQKVDFVLEGLPMDQIVDTVGKWTLPTKYVNESYPYPYPFAPTVCTSYRINSSLLENTNVTSCWFVNGQGGHVSVGLYLQFTNGQHASLAAKGDFMVYRPQITGLDTNGNPSVGFGTNDGIFIGVSDGYGSTRHEMAWDLYVDVDLIDHPGTLSYLQLIQESSGYDYWHLPMPFPVPVWSSTSGEYWLDNSTEYRDSHVIKANDLMSAELLYGDAPGIKVDANSYVQQTDNFLTYVRFQPDGGIPVTIGIVDWGWVGDAEKSGGVWSLVTGTLSGPRHNSDDSFPLWEHILDTGINH